MDIIQRKSIIIRETKLCDGRKVKRLALESSWWRCFSGSYSLEHCENKYSQLPLSNGHEFESHCKKFEFIHQCHQEEILSEIGRNRWFQECWPEIWGKEFGIPHPSIRLLKHCFYRKCAFVFLLRSSTLYECLYNNFNYCRRNRPTSTHIDRKKMPPIVFCYDIFPDISSYPIAISRNWKIYYRLILFSEK